MRKLVAFLALVFLAGSTARAEGLFLDFEQGKMGKWRYVPASLGRDSLGIELAGSEENNHSRGFLHCFVRNGLPDGSVSYVLGDNGMSPIRVTPRTKVAWCWWASKNEDTNGYWLSLRLRNTRTGVIEDARFVTWREYSHSAIRAYFDPSQVWIYHCEALYDYLWRRYEPAVVDSFVIECITLGTSFAPKLEALVDNIWIGDGDPPDSVNTIVTVEKKIPLSSKLRGFSYGFLDSDWIPDRVDVYRDRAEIFLNPHASERGTAVRGDSKGPSVQVKEVKPLQRIEFDPQRVEGIATIADLNGDGRDDILFSFDDLLGSRCFKGGAPGSPFREVPLESGALFMEQEYSYGAAVSDVDLDGDLDVLQINPYPRRYNFGGIRFAQNERNWSFADGTVDSRILSQLAFGCAFGDVNGDGFQDLFAGYRWYYDPDSVASVNHLYLNDGQGRFIAAPDRLVLPGGVLVAGGVFADFDNDGDLDLYVVVSEARPRLGLPRNMLFLNDGTGRFRDASDGCGTARSDSSRTALAEDFDNDGLVDLYVMEGDGRCVFYKNTGTGRFEPVKNELIASEPGIRAIAVDLDADGDMDIALLAHDRADPICIENTNSNGQNFIEVRLRAGSGGHAGIGGKVFAYESGHLGEADRLVGFREINPSRGFRQYVPPIAHFGLGKRDKVDLEVVFSPERGRAPVVVRERGVSGGSFIEISEHENALARVVSDALVRWRGGFERALFRVPSWLFAILALVVICAAAMMVRIRAVASSKSGIDALLLAAIIVAAGLAVYRSFAWGAGALALAFLLILYQARLQEILRSIFQSRSWRESAIEFLLEELSQATHTEKKYAFLMEMSFVGEGGARVPARAYDSEFKALRKLVSMMRMATPNDQKWRQAGAEIKTMRKILGDLRKPGKNGEDIGQFEISERTVELKHAVDRFNTLLRDYRATLRRTLSVSFAEEWRSLRGEYESTLDEQHVTLEETFPAEIGVVRIHLTEDEFGHIFKNCFDNSLRALRKAAEKRIRVAASPDATHLTVSWIDTGAGIPKHLVGGLFNEVVPSSSPEGKGEGCAITGQKIRRRGGVVRLEEPSRGKGASIVMKFLRVK